MVGPSESLSIAIAIAIGLAMNISGVGVLAQLAQCLAHHRPSGTDGQGRHHQGDGQIGPSGTSAKYAHRCQHHSHVADGVVAAAQPHTAQIGVASSECIKQKRHADIVAASPKKSIASASKETDPDLSPAAISTPNINALTSKAIHSTRRRPG